MTGLSAVAGTFILNEDRAQNQTDVETVALPDGGFIAIWRDNLSADGQTAGAYHVVARRYDANGVAVGAEFQIDSLTNGLPFNPTAIALANGTFVVSWEDNANSTIRARVFSADGTAIGTELVLASGQRFDVSLAALANGGFVATWSDASAGGATSVETRGQIFSATGTAVSGVLSLNATTTGFQGIPDVVGTSNGGFIVVWQDNSGLGGDASAYGIKARQFDSSGQPIGGEFLVNTSTAGDQVGAKVTVLDNGGFVVTWVDGSAGGFGVIKARLFDANGSALGQEFAVSASPASDEAVPVVVAVDGGFVVSWSEGLPTDTSDVYAQLFSNNGSRIGAETLINTTVPGNQIGSSLSVLESGELLVAWANDNGTRTSGQINTDVEARLFSVPADVPTGSVWNAPAGDFNGDGRDDVLWRNDNGVVTNWLGQANGGFVGNHANAAIQVGVEWHIVGTGDFNGDGRDDVLWRNDSGVVTDWLGQTNGGFTANHSNAATGVPLDWTIVGVGDFNGDGKDDVLWRNDSGVITNWLGQTNGGFAGNHANAATGVPLDWHVVGTGDFNGDGRDDVLWRNDSGVVTNWLGQANGGFVANHANAATGVPLDWNIVGTGDFNGDGRDDVLWRNDNGVITNWLGQANGGFVGNHGNAATGVPLDWDVAGTGDFNGDGRDDVLWRNVNGVVTDWLGQANGGFAGNHANAATGVPLEWQIQPQDPFWS